MKQIFKNIDIPSVLYVFLVAWSFTGRLSLAGTCTTTTVCTYVTAYCSSGTAADTTFPRTIYSMKFNYTKVDPSAVSTCSGNNGTVTCHGGTTNFSVTTLPAPNGNCTFTPADSLPTTVNCRYNTSTCATTCTASTPVTTCT